MSHNGSSVSASELEVMRHSAAHILAKAVQRLYPGSKLGIGPVIENGFYYDIDIPSRVGDEDLPRIEAEMRDIVAAAEPFKREEWSKDQALQHYASAEDDNPYKREIIEALAEDEPISFYWTGPDWVDLCRGPHVANSSQLKAFKLTNVAGAYWRGDERRPMLQRIYGTAWQDQDQLDHYLALVEDARRRDHRRIGKELGLFMFSDLVGPGLPLWLPRGATIRRELERWVTDLELERGYQHVITPDVAKVEMYKVSGHWAHYQDSMFPVMHAGEEELVLRPMNCPHHIQIYQYEQRSYRELPMRIAEFGTMWRYEKSGELSGLSRVRRMDLNDAHIFCTPDQIQDEIVGVVELIEDVYRVLGISDHWYRLSLWDPNDKEKYVDNPEMWERGERYLKEAMARLGLDYVEAPGEAAFYGPKIDIQLRDPLGHSETISTIQVDFHLPNQFQLEYVGEDGQFHRPVMIHRGVIGTLVRMIAYLIEKYGGAFPLWLAPVQAVVIPIADRHVDYASGVAAKLRKAGFRVEVDSRREKMQAKIRDAQAQQVPYMLVVGDRDQQAGTVSVRERREGDLGASPLDEFVAVMQARREDRT
ncbi:MAG: threonine--tRNA ligase [Chloroflexi bacterium]|nr:threonine--tRNA ligase [Chloroflexota bacterium]MBV9600350.1 threonine--tRNA ligase [Chloroflexota bacterium]